MSDKVTVNPRDPATKNSPIAGPVQEEATVMMNAAAKVCHWNGQEFAEGQYVESEGVTYECSMGQWVKS